MRLKWIISLIIISNISLCVAGELKHPDRLIADFIMKRKLVALSETLTSSGRFYLGGPGVLRWETQSPSKSVMVIKGDLAWIHYPEFNVTKAFDMSSDPAMKILAGHLLVLAGTDYSRLQERYQISELPAGGKALVPKAAEVRRLFSVIRVQLTEQSVVRRVEMVSVSGDTTIIEFDRLQLNPEISPTIFAKPNTQKKE